MLYHSLAFEKRDDGKALGTAGRPCKLEPYHGCCHWIRHRNVKLRAGFRDMVGIREVFEKRVPFQVRGVQWLDKTFATDRGRRNNELDHRCWKLAVLRKRSQVDP